MRSEIHRSKSVTSFFPLSIEALRTQGVRKNSLCDPSRSLLCTECAARAILSFVQKLVRGSNFATCEYLGKFYPSNGLSPISRMIMTLCVSRAQVVERDFHVICLSHAVTANISCGEVTHRSSASL